ncbi:uncharacterized protein LOC100183938 isoform X1 [Ciona intestinalis]
MSSKEKLSFDSLEQVCDLVDDFLCCENNEKNGLFWNTLYTESTLQQMYIQCLIYKYISITYGLGQKPLREALRIIKNLTSNPAAVKSHSLDAPSPLQLTHPAVSAPTSPSSTVLAQKRNRAATGPSRRISLDLKSQQHRSSLGPEPLGNKLRRKTSAGLLETQQKALQEEEERVSATKLRSLLYTLYYVVNTCDARKWDFTALRDSFLLWNKARSWGKDASEFESTVMKMFSRPPDDEKEKNTWHRLASNVIGNFNLNANHSHLDDKQVGESIKYWLLRNKINQSTSPVGSVINGLIETAEKVYEDNEESKVLPLLHILCETIIMAQYVPIDVLQRAYAALQMFYLWSTPIAAAVKEVLDLIQIEMKSPGYFWRLLFFQEQEVQHLSSPIDISLTCSSTNIFVDTSITHGKQLQVLFEKYSTTAMQYKEDGIPDTSYHNRVLMKQMFNSVFGWESCDIAGLERLLKVCPSPLLATLTSEALQVMEQSVEMANHNEAQAYIRLQLECISNKFTEDTDESGDLDAAMPDMPRASVIFPTLKPNENNPMLPTLKRNNSYLNRIAAAHYDKPCLMQEDNDDGDIMNHAPVTINIFNKSQISDTMFQIVRTTAKEFVQEKRKSTSASSFRSRYRSRGRSHLVEDDARDSGLIEDAGDFPEEDKHASPIQTKHDQTGKIDKKMCGKFWEEFSECGFEENKNTESNLLEELLNTMTLEEDVAQDVAEKTEKSSSGSGSLEVSPEKVKIEDPPSPFDTLNTNEDDLTSNLDDVQFEMGIKANRSKTYKNRFKTLGRKGLKAVRAVKRTASSRVAHYDPYSDHRKKKLSQEETVANVAKDGKPRKSSCEEPVVMTPPPLPSESGSHRWRTYSDPFKKSGKRSKSGKYTHISQLFSSQTDVNEQNHTLQPTSSSGSLKPSLSFTKSLDHSKDENPNSDNVITASQNPGRYYTLQSRKHSTETKLEDEDSRIRMDSGIVLDKDGDRVFQNFSLPDWEETGIAGVKSFRKQAVRRTRKSRSSLSHISPRPLRKKVVKLVFAGNDETLGHLARSYYELRTRQATRAPLLQHVDLRLFYIPVGESSFADEAVLNLDGDTIFDLKVAKMLGASDPWYQSTVLQTASNLLRVCPTTPLDENLEEDENATKFLTPQKLVQKSLLSYCRYALKTSYLPLYKAKMRTSADEIITEIFCCVAEIGNLAYKQAVKAGRFGKLGRLVDLSNDGPPPAYSVLEYSKIGINGSYSGLKTLNEAFYYSVQVTPEELVTNNTKGSGNLHVTLIENGRKVKGKQSKTPVEEEPNDIPASVIRASDLNMEVIQPPQGTITICLDNSLIFTNIKSIEIQRCIAPEYEKSFQRKKRQNQNTSRMMSLPIKTFWPTL